MRLRQTYSGPTAATGLAVKRFVGSNLISSTKTNPVIRGNDLLVVLQRPAFPGVSACANESDRGGTSRV